MPGEMRAACNKNFYIMPLQVEEAKLPRKIWGFLEKINRLLFFRFDDCELFEGGAGANAFNTFLPNTTMLEILSIFFEMKYLMLNLKKCLFAIIC